MNTYTIYTVTPGRQATIEKVRATSSIMAMRSRCGRRMTPEEVEAMKRRN